MGYVVFCQRCNFPGRPKLFYCIIKDVMQDVSKVVGDYKSFLDKIFENLKKSSIDVSGFELDHIAYRVDTYEKYETMKKRLGNYSTLVAETTIRNRPIAIFKLSSPLVYKKFSIPCIELPAPAEDHNFPDGLEHAEFVINTPPEDFLHEHQNLDFVTKALSRKVNPELILKFSDCAVKFHTRNIIEAAAITKRTGEL